MLISCDGGGSGGDGGGSSPPSSTLPPTASEWQAFVVKDLNTGGLTTPHVTAKMDSVGQVHIAYFSDGPTYSAQNYLLNYLIWDPVTQAIVDERQTDPQPPAQGQEGVDSCGQFAMDLSDADEPVLVYQGGEIREAGFEDQSDVMISKLIGGQWYEGTAAMGFVERNPIIFDGWAGPNMDVAVDSSGTIHTCYQFFYEGVDADNLRYPDVFYTQRPGDTFDLPVADNQWAGIEEQVDGNQFVNGQWAVHNSVGYFCKIVLDADEHPAVFYAEHTENTHTFRMKVARRSGADQWAVETIDDLPNDWQVGAISAAVAPDGTLGVAYYLAKPAGASADLGDYLKYAEYVNGQWQVQTVDESSWCGKFCALAFNAAGQPAVAYFDERSHGGFERLNLKYAIRTDLGWQRGTVAETGTIGWYNTIWFDSNGAPNISTYSASDDRIVIYRFTAGAN